MATSLSTCGPHLTRFLGPIRAHNPNGISIGSDVFAQSRVSLYFTSWNNSTCVAYGELPMSSGRTTYQILKSWRSARYLALKPFLYQLNFAGPGTSVTSYAWVRTGCRSKLSTVSLNMAHVPVVDSGRGTRTCWSTIWRRAVSIEGTRDISRGQIIVACDMQSFGATLWVSKSCRAEEEAIPPYAKQAEDRQLAALLASRVAAFVLLGLVSAQTTKLILIIRDQRSIVSTAQSTNIIIIIIFHIYLFTKHQDW